MLSDEFSPPRGVAPLSQSFHGIGGMTFIGNSLSARPPAAILLRLATVAPSQNMDKLMGRIFFGPVADCHSIGKSTAGGPYLPQALPTAAGKRHRSLFCLRLQPKFDQLADSLGASLDAVGFSPGIDRPH